MITTIHYNPFNTRDLVLEILKANPDMRVLEVGGATSFADGYLDTIIDINPPLAQSRHFIQGNINMPEVWEKVKEHVSINGKWDFAICTHTLEDISNPLLVCQMMEQVAKAGFIAVPSKFWEFGRFGVDTYRGFIHHRWIFDNIDGEFVGFPKINYIENKRFDAIAQHPHAEFNNELSLWWEGSIGMKIVNNDFLGPTETAVMEYYDVLLKNL